MSSRTSRRIAAVAAASLLGITAACSSSENTSTETTTTTAAAKEPASAGTTIDIMLTEWEVKPSASTAPAGTITFTSTNNGAETHELALFKTDLDPASLPLDEEGAVDERGEGVELIDEVENVKAGETKSFTVDNVAPGNYLLVCNLVERGDSHFGHNMYTPFTVE